MVLTTLIKVAAVLVTIAFDPSVQMSTEWKKQITLVLLEKEVDHTGPLKESQGSPGAQGPYFVNFYSRFM